MVVASFTRIIGPGFTRTGLPHRLHTLLQQHPSSTGEAFGPNRFRRGNPSSSGLDLYDVAGKTIYITRWNQFMMGLLLLPCQIPSGSGETNAKKNILKKNKHANFAKRNSNLQPREAKTLASLDFTDGTRQLYAQLKAGRIKGFMGESRSHISVTCCHPLHRAKRFGGSSVPNPWR